MTVKQLEQLTPKEAEVALKELPLKEVFRLLLLARPEYIAELGNTDSFLKWIGPLIKANHALQDEVSNELREALNAK